LTISNQSLDNKEINDEFAPFFRTGCTGHDYGTIETRGFRKLVVEQNGSQATIDNPRWEKA
jgi:glucose-6-phosphate isomerase